MTTFSSNLLGVHGGNAALSILLLVLLFASVSDIKSHRIPNLLTFPAAVLGIALHLAMDGVWGGASALIGYLVLFFGGFLFYRWIGGIGAGDIKLLMACAAFIGIMPTLYVAFVSFLLQTVWLMIRWLIKGTAVHNIRQLAIWLYTWAVPGLKVQHFHPVGTPDRSPHGPFILAGAACTVLLWWGGHVQL